LRFNWNAALALDPFDAGTIYYGSQFVHKSTDRGDSWALLSPDVTSNNPEWQKQFESGGLTLDVTGAENFTTIITIAPSAVERGVIWVGSDDGRVHVTRDAGQTWTSVEGNLKGVPANTWIPHIEPSKFNGGTAFVVFDDHRRSNWAPYVYKTTDYGKTWTSLVTKDVRGYALVVEQDPVKEELLFLGTEFGLFVSLDAGKNWFQWKHGFPTASAMDLAIHPREHDLVVATHGRAAYVLDDIRPLRMLTAATLAEPLHLFEIPEAQQYMVKQTGASRFPGQGEYRGDNREYGALITYSLNFDDLPLPNEEKERERKEKERQAQREKQRAAGETPEEEKKDEKKPQVDIEITDASGKVIRKFKGPAVRGVNRAAWNLRRDEFKEPRRDDDQPSFFQPGYLETLPGAYGVTLKYKDKEAKATLQVAADPRYSIPRADREAKWAAIEQGGKLQERLAEAIDLLRDTRADSEQVVKKLQLRQRDKKEGKGDKDLLKAARALQQSLTRMEKRLWVPPGTKGIVGDADALSKARYVLRSLGSSWDSPTEAQRT
ncbi:MAG: WD40/YVTN/BNR-like repeat-containing protein, partial [Candidatus Acidiferrales bacterium]